MNTCRVDCSALENQEVDVDFNLKVWPCCIMQNQYAEYGKVGDDYIDNLPKDWNQLGTKTWKQILEHPVFKEYLTQKIWNSNKCSPVCAKFCGKEGFMNYDVKEFLPQKD
tara:strand:- start:5757 stop:6086 length:330 start_codon:yes stop_codon:yes gene_type:complete